MQRILFVITEDWALVSHRLHLVDFAIKQGFEVAVATRMNSYRSDFEKMGMTVFDWPLDRRSLNPLREIAAILKLRKFINSFKPDLIHTVALKPVIYTGIATRLSFRGAIVSALGGVGYIFASDRLRARLLRFPARVMLKLALYGRQRRLILQNMDDVNLFAGAKAVPASHIHLVKGAGVEVDLFGFAELPSSIQRVILPARLLWDKGIGEFVNVARRIIEKKPDVKFVLVGDVDSQNPASIKQEQIDAWVAEGCVEQLRRVRHEQMPEIYKDASIVCLPSYREGLPKVLLEGASTGRPVVAFDVPGCRDIVIDGQNGVLVPLGREDLLEDAIMSLLKDRRKREQFGRNGRDLVCSEFSSDVINKQTINIWQSLIET